MKIAFIGLGVMGFPMAGHLQQAGHSVTVYNRTRARADAWCDEHGGERAATPAAAATGAELVCCCVGNDDDVRAVLLAEDGALPAMAAGSLLVDHTTASARLARELYTAAAARQIDFLDAPVSGGQGGAENGALTVMLGGDQEAFERLEPVLTAYAARTRLLGPAGSGQLAKMVNQICIAGIVQGLAEGLSFAERAGLDAAAVVEVICGGAAQSWQMENRYKTMLADDYDHGFAVDWMRKDLGLVQEEAARFRLGLPLTSLVDAFYADVQHMGGGRWDTSSLFARMRALDRLGRPPDSGEER
jgi:3-hydroxyisobutyrate dehydrogenase-like beta-hydroxyacid dehydrogenase